MSKQKNTVAYVWKDRKHWAWFPFSFTVYAVADERLHITRGFFSKAYDETLLYRITDLTLRRSFAQRIFGTGTIVLNTLVDKDKTIELINIKKSIELSRMKLLRTFRENTFMKPLKIIHVIINCSAGI